MASNLGQTQLEYPAATDAGVQVNIQPLPQRPAPLPDELLSSWIARLADANHCSVPELCRYLGFDGEHPPETLAELQGANIERFCAISRLSRSDLKGMLLARRMGFPVECISWSDFQHCPACTRETPRGSLRHWRYAWSLSCKFCGAVLEQIRVTPGDDGQVSSRLRTRAIEGARQLEQVYRSGNHHDARRMGMTVQIAGVLLPEIRHGVLFSQNRHDRYTMIAALSLGMSRPLIAAALIVRNDHAAEARLRAAFPNRRKLLKRLVRLADSLPSRKIEGREKRIDQFLGQRINSIITARPEFLAAAKQAIDQLGDAADPSELLRCAETILNTTRQKPVDT